MSKRTRTTQSQLDLTISATFNAVNAADLAQASFQDLGGLFRAIMQLTVKGSNSHDLARIGRYLSEDWGDMNDGNSEFLSKCLSELQAMKEHTECSERLVDAV